MAFSFNFCDALHHSTLFSSTLDIIIENAFDNQLSEIFKHISPILIYAMKSNVEIQSLFKKLITLCFINIYNSQKTKNQFSFSKTLNKSMSVINKIKIKTSEKITDTKSLPLHKYFCKKNARSININKLPKELLCKTMCFIDPVELAQIESTSHMFLQCARQPISISNFTQRFFDKVYDNFTYSYEPLHGNTTEFMHRYSVLKNVHIDRNLLLNLYDKAKKKKYVNISGIFLSWIHLDEATVKSLILIRYEQNKDDTSIFLSDYYFNILRGLKYFPCIISLHIYSEHYIPA
eukprot:421631_1